MHRSKTGLTTGVSGLRGHPCSERVAPVPGEVLAVLGRMGACRRCLTAFLVLEFAGVPFTGPSSGCCRLARDKAVARTITERAGLVAPRWSALSSSSSKELGGTEVVRYLVEDVA